MADRRLIVTAIVLCHLALPAVLRADEVLPSLSAEKMSEYKNAFSKAISESRGAGGDRPNGGPNDGKGPDPRGGRPERPDGGLSNVTKHMRDGFDSKGPRPDAGPGHFPPGVQKGFGGGDGMRPPPGFGGSGQPGGPPPHGGPH